MASTPRILLLGASALLALGLTGCAAGAHMRDTRASGATGAMGSMDMQSMCEQHRRMMAGRPPAEQQAMLQEQMKSMAPEMRQRMQAMHEQCK
jgi:hypothetical protein